MRRSIPMPARLLRAGLFFHLFCLSSLGIFLAACGRKADPKVKDTVTAAIKAHGGMENFQKIRSISRLALVETREEEAYLTVELIRFPESIRWERHTGGGTIIDARNEKGAWSDPYGQGEPERASEERSFSLKDRMGSLLGFFVFHLPEFLADLTLQSEDERGGVVLSRTQGDLTFTYHIEGETHRVVRREVLGKVEKIPIDAAVEFLEYKEQEGLQVPHLLQVYQGKELKYKEFLCHLSFNQSLPDAIFDDFRYSVITRESRKAIMDGESMVEMGDLDGAIQHYTKAVERVPYSGKLWYFLGRAYRANGNWEKALQCFQAALERGELGPYIFTSEGEVLYHLGRLQEASEYFQKAAFLPFPVPSAYFHLGLIFRKEGKFKEAEGNLYKALDPGYPQDEVLYNLAQLYLEDLKDKEKARLCFQRLLQITQRPEYAEEAKRALAGLK